ncbi:alanine racemase [Acetobacter cerevisiae]|uniref:Alanine racemase n=1 Tax=Acetobacter cerevisiae TaxID=178900 RepID=A0A149UXL6_9PROT|nr:alanine racemase [Acetobacter cerevisiae]KXV72717.1 alanine racemase [Acetobacter cerevisiae]MCP1245802.1 alanine racemase [Acetobacter cerevisiae]MCP1255324.1 alanine racemase [Acetobacter cerevisiae]
MSWVVAVASSCVSVSPNWPAHRAGAVLTIDLAAIAANYRLLDARTPGALCAAVVKSDAYGLGAAQVAPVLEQAGARHFFVAHVDEGLALRQWVSPSVQITVLHGARPEAAEDCVQSGLRPVLNSLEQVSQLQALADKLGRPLDAALQLDTGMSRFGLSGADVRTLVHEPERLRGISLSLIMSHLACADTPENPANAEQLQTLQTYAALLPKAPLSLAASSGIFLGQAFHQSLVRPGAALYGIAPNTSGPNPLAPVLKLQAHILQIRQLSKGDRVGYGLTWQADGPRRVATIATGYADGFARQGAGKGCAWFGGQRLPILGRISMDSMTVDISHIPEGLITADDTVDLLNASYGVDAVAEAEGTIGYEVLTSLGRRYHRVYEKTEQNI